ncbi:DUF4153 domain-containing protein [Roseovarius nanhaiticus]|uniref:DUF4153 domain-containing protein n=1 Tax=Roseovarius nanhaiticus TaxID=573024 RepID=UPI0024924165|nr:DUF4153 domain-containing protein [Roseovarius nanhaiticus]
MIPTSQTATTRLLYTVIGGGAGLCTYVLAMIVPEAVAHARAVLFLLSFGLGFLAILLALMGPVRVTLAAAAALGIALPAALLLLWASYRHETPSAFLDGGYGLAAFLYLLFISTPFAVARLQHHGGWRHYGLLFDAAWDLVVRIASAGLFVGVVWAVLLLSDQLLGLVGISAVQDLIDLEPVPFLITGMALGLSLAIVHELRDYVSPFLIIQLLRVFLPALLVVLAVFILALPFRGLGNLFGQYSAAAILLGVTGGGITLITTAIHRDDSLSVEGWGMRSAAQALSVMLVVPALLALWAIWLRVDQYGLTPNRIAALVAAGIVAIYALFYAGAVLRRRAWRADQRDINRGMAVLTLALAAAWLTPILNAERMAARSQLARAEAGTPPKDLPLWELANDWGKAGKLALSRIEDMAADDPDLQSRIAAARRSDSRWSYEAQGGLTRIDGLVPLRPEGRSLPPGALDTLHEGDRRLIAEGCARRAPGGHPGCVLVIAPFEPGAGAEQAIGFFMTSPTTVVLRSFTLGEDTIETAGYPSDLAGGGYVASGPEVITEILEGRFDIVPAARQVLEVDGMRLFP